MGERSRSKTRTLAVLEGAVFGKKDGDMKLSPGELHKVVRRLEHHAVLPVCYDVLCAMGIDATEREHIEKVCKRIMLQNYRLFFLTLFYVRALEEAGIEVAVLKGISVGWDYPAFETRKSGDVDLYLVDADDYSDACRVLYENGARQGVEQHADHHVSFIDMETGIEIELHTSLVEDTGNTDLDRGVSEAEKEIRRRTIRRSFFGDHELSVLPDYGQALHLLLHMLQHFIGTGFGLRLLLDWVYFWNGEGRLSAAEDYLRLAGECGLLDFSDLVTDTCGRYLGLSPDAGDRLLSESWKAKNESDRTHLVELFLEEVFASEEFGQADKSRTIIPGERGIFGMIKAFHDQTRFNFPVASRIVILYPILDIMTLIIFWRNNRKLRHTSTIEVIRTAKDRRMLLDELKIIG